MANGNIASETLGAGIICHALAEPDNDDKRATSASDPCLLPEPRWQTAAVTAHRVAAFKFTLDDIKICLYV
jgi:hypothetical protein